MVIQEEKTLFFGGDPWLKEKFSTSVVVIILCYFLLLFLFPLPCTEEKK